MLLEVDREDPYFFDHPVDHVPALRLIGGLLDLCRNHGLGDPEAAGRLGIALRFPAFCEIAPIRLDAARVPGGAGSDGTADGRFWVSARQGNRIVSDGEMTFAPDPAARPSPTSRQAASVAPPYLRPADLTLVHQRHPENVMISDLVAGDGIRTVAVRRPPAGHRMAVTAEQPMRTEVLVDAARQLATLLGHAYYGRPLTIRNVLLQMDADLPCGLRSHAYLRWKCVPQLAKQLVVDSEVVADDPDGEPCGRIRLDIRSATPTAYRRIRGRAGQA